MSVQPVPAGRALERLFTPGIRLGWTFRDRRAPGTPFSEPQPDPEFVHKQIAERVAITQSRYARARRWVIKPTLVLGLVLLLVAGYANGTHRAADGYVLLAVAVIVTGSGLGYTIRSWWRKTRAAAARPERSYRKAVQAWQQRAVTHEQAELARAGDVPEWSAAAPPARRTDVFGGSLAGWQALLITHGTSILAAGPLLVMDLSGQLASRELTDAARAAAIPAAQYVLPADLGRCGLLTCLSPSQFADAFAEAVHAGTPGGARTDRAVDVRVLEQLAAALGGWITPARLAAAAQAALGQPAPPGLLSAQEEALIGGDLFPREYRQQLGPNLIRLDASLIDLASYAGHAPPVRPAAPSYYTCLALDAGARSARAEMLTALAIGWLTAQVSASDARAPAVIIVGADEITRPHLERLASACERRGVPLTIMFRHLREDALHVLGGGTPAFMRLGNHAEAEQAASYIGRQHQFVLSQFTATVGGSQTFTRSDTDGTSWSDAASAQQVYEYAVEPAVLQNLPDRALLLAIPSPNGPQLQPVECDPAIATLSGVGPQAPMPRPVPTHVDDAQLPPAGPPAWPAASGWPPKAARPA